MKSYELTGALLNYWAAHAAGIPAMLVPLGGNKGLVCRTMDGRPFCPSSLWEHGGMLIETFDIDVTLEPGCGYYGAVRGDVGAGAMGPDRLTAATRALVVWKYGDDVPEPPLAVRTSGRPGGGPHEA